MQPRNLIGALPTALVGLATTHHGLVLGVVNALRGESAAFFHDQIAEALKQRPLAPPQVEVEPPPPLVVVKKTSLPGGAILTTYHLGRRMTFGGMFRALLKVSEETVMEEVARLLQSRGHVLTSAQLDRVIELQEKFLLKVEDGVDFGLRTDGWWNFVPVENEDGSVSVVNVSRGDVRWLRSRRSLADDDVWTRENRLVVSNSHLSRHIVERRMCRVLLFYIHFPSDKHFTRLYKMLRDSRILSIRQHLHFPRDHKEEFCEV